MFMNWLECILRIVGPPSHSGLTRNTNDRNCHSSMVLGQSRRWAVANGGGSKVVALGSGSAGNTQDGLAASSNVAACWSRDSGGLSRRSSMSLEDVVVGCPRRMGGA